MSLKTIAVPPNHPTGLAHIKVGGRRRPTQRPEMPSIARFFGAPILPPASTNYRAVADPALTRMFANDSRGDCVCAARYHRIGQLTALAGKPFVATDAQVLADYSRVGGWDPKNPDATDNGCDMQTNNDDAVAIGYADGSKDLGWLVVDGTNRQLMQQVIYLFEGSVDLGIELPDAYVDPFPSGDGFTWDVAGAPNPENGHCIQVIDYDEKGLIVSTWGMWGTLTWAAAAKYLAKKAFGEAYLHLSSDQIARGQARAPNGFDANALVTFFDQQGGNVPVPAPAPTPTPVPPPPTPTPKPPAPTKFQVQEWLREGFAKGPHVMTAAQAELLAHRVLDKQWPK